MKASSAAVAATPIRGAAEGKAAVATETVSSSSLSLLQYGASLYEAHAHLPDEAEVQLPLTRYADYLHHCGFSMEQESKTAAAPVPAAAAAVLDHAKPNTKTKTPLEERRGAGVEVDTPYNPVEIAGWGLPEALRCDADLRCNAVGSLSDATEWSTIAEQLVTPFMTPTWRQTATQCTIKKARCVYMWLCSHMTLQVSVPGTVGKAVEDSGPASTGSQPSSQRTAPLARSSTQPARKVKEVLTMLEPAAPPHPLAVALQTRRAPAPVLAEVYMRMLTSIGISCEVVDGQLKGAAPEEAFEWSWNIVTVEGKQYLVDVSAALSKGVLRPSAPPSDVSSLSGVSLDAGKALRGGSVAARGKAAAPPPPSSLEEPWNGSVRLLPVTPERLRRDFFFFAYPTSFLASHLPANPAKALVQTAMKIAQWRVQPRLTPAFYHYRLQLASHKTHSAFVAKESPSYVSFVNHYSSDTELCCVLYMGTLRTLPEDLSQTIPLGAEWVWHQREESTNTDTFTLTVPQAGYYVLVVGARPIRVDPYSAVITVVGETAFTPVASYDMRVCFTPSSSPMLPRQYLSPSVCRLISPLCSQLSPGRHTFCVMPSCSNVIAVAVVKCITAAATRELLSFLSFQPCSATFEGAVDVRIGDGVEVWVLYGAPDRNGQELSQRVPAAAPPKVAVRPCTSSSLTAKSKATNKRKAEASAEQQRATAAEAQFAHLSQALRRGEVFQRYVGGIEVRYFVSPAVATLIQPQPTVKQEQSITLRRLAGVTSALLCEAAETVQHQPAPVGRYFAAAAATAASKS
ncbi:conserved hypothetical protein [Leishmania braziliensis MHOM/BR/75/M2904]|uniref:Uncharacterized protein n=2 Tax=Leishmania braziliensis TaxID=5660 RepID=A4H7Y1_LEIBR|nr:conserved hypothetical protein [Leishmania braziliensis MHOM/BR/75/M2904]KAI5691922.1 hypothetical protein MNV84_01998 [Leishmania braziliensis]CAJ2469221.1 unnamed protein product [Leishmania braziliensis]CAM42028.1 conserved hypothetical protein [Leishmania braziliensis MHOM/BR/75/M2904]SYZ64146.1 hypothetical_protein [Leishmania braziliensis MHOM/BR/75/M2904]